MCTMIVMQVEVEGRSKAAGGWLTVRHANVSYDHPFSLPLEHALNIDFVDEAQGPGARVAVELTVESARTLVETIQTVLARAEAGGYLEEDRAQNAFRVTPRATGQPPASPSADRLR